MKQPQPWSMARVASRRELPKPRKMMGPVGQVPAPNGEMRAAWDADGNAFAIACKACGHDVCSCKPYDYVGCGVERLKATLIDNPGYELRADKYVKLDQAYPYHQARRIFCNPVTLKAFTDELERAGVPCRVASFEPVERPIPVITSANVPRGHVFFVQDTRPGSVDVAGLEKLRAERFTDYHLRKAAEREF